MRGVLLAIGLIGAALVYTAVDAGSGIPAWWKLCSALEHSRTRVSSLEVRDRELEERLRALRQDPFATEQAIREDLGLVRPGEILVRLPPVAPRDTRLP